jgi:hypothetical protein
MSDRSSTALEVVSRERIQAEINRMSEQASNHLAMFHKADGAVQALMQLLVQTPPSEAMSVPELEMIVGGKIDQESLKAIDG